jgi:hypothetical protein
MEHRILPRARRLKEARVVFNGKKSVMSGIVRDLTDNGARLKTGEPYLIPELFDFVMVGEKSRPARKIWNTATEMGISFKFD